MKYIIPALFIVGSLMAMSCCSKSQSGSGEKPIEIPDGDVTVAVYYFPNWSLPVTNSEWGLLQSAQPKFANHRQPKVPAWGYEDENKPAVMSKKIDAAADNGVDVFIFDWYYYDPNSHFDGGGSKYLYKALEEGYLGASNNSKVKFSIMWCNHDLGNIAIGAVTPATIDSMMDYVIEKYFKHPSYWLIDGCPYFSIYEMKTFFASYGNETEKVAEAIAKFRQKVKDAGFPDLHLNGVLWAMNGTLMNIAVEKLNVNSSTSYVWIHHNSLPGFPSTEYSAAGDKYFESVKNGGGVNGLENPASRIPVPYHINVSMGWDSSPRCGNVTTKEWLNRRDYPFGAVIVNNTPYLFKKYLAEAKKLTMQKAEKDRIITINSWNEWGEGSYIEPDNINGMAYLEAVRDVFGNKK